MKTIILAITLMLGLTSFGQETTCGRNLKYNLVYVEYIGTDYTDGIYVDLFSPTDAVRAAVNLIEKYDSVNDGNATTFASKTGGCFLVFTTDIIAITPVID